MSTRFVIFSDLDATLLDHQTYSYQAASLVLKKLKKKKIPLVLCTSKTRAETEFFARKLGLSHPFIVENGGAIFIPEGYFPDYLYRKAAVRAIKSEGYSLIQLGTSYRKLHRVFQIMKKSAGIRLIGFGDLSSEEIAAVTGLSLRMARLARQREFDEPFFLKDSLEFRLSARERRRSGCGISHRSGKAESKETKSITEQETVQVERSEDELQKQLRQLARIARFHGLKITSGGRFFHLTGNSDKGRAVRILKKLYRFQLGKVVTIGFGDSANDWPMLRAVDLPVLVARPDGSWAEIPGMEDKIFKASLPGPEGWAEAVSYLLAEFIK